MELPTNVQISSRGVPAGEHWILGLFAEDEPEHERLPDAIWREVAAARRRSGAGRPGWRAESVAALGARQVRVSVVGCGPADRFDGRSARRWLGDAVARAFGEGTKGVVVRLPRHPAFASREHATRAIATLASGGYRFDRFRDAPEPEGGRTVRVLPPAGVEAEYRAARTGGLAIAAGVRLARDLGNTPPNEATPAWLAARARDLARAAGGRALVLGPRELRRRGMRGILAVGQGSAQPPRLVRLELGNRGPRVALVGKGVTFDSGGISIKPAASMEEMKYDKCGACAVLGAAHAAAALDLPVRLGCFLPLAENMPDAGSYRPSDIVRCANGKTVEIVNTDAEGRMILADALTWAAGWKPDHLVELSTLTGACVVALGAEAAALYSPDDALAGELLTAAGASGERLWRMPLWPEYGEQMKGEHADLKNSGGRWGGANLAAAFLAEFAGAVPSWAHLDIAGPAYATKETPGQPVGATGYGVATLVQWLIRRSGRSS
ncbi:MAG TPA: leucyl aminopeptidase [Thermoanaerobaculia bacterium]|nr:leucyl aminopeptidase [Thermoanaerobaculia bacterium]